MKTQKISLLALAVLAGGITAASAASAKTEASATYSMRATNATAPTLVPSSVPRSLVFKGLQSVTDSVDTDASGKIEGIAILQYGSPASNGYVRYVTSVTGSVKGNGSSPAVVQIKLKGNGYSGPGTNVNGILEAVGTPASLQLTYKSTGAIVSNLLAGTFNGTVKSGVPALDSLTGNGKVKDSAAVLDINPFNVGEIDAIIVQVGSKLYGQSYFPFDATVSGNVGNSKKVSLKGKGVGSAKGASWKLDGNTAVIPVGTTNNTVKLFSTADMVGKWYGQQFKRTSVVTATPVAN